MPNLADLKVLVVDDMEDLRLFHKRWMSMENIHVITAESGQEGIDHLQKNPDINVVILDMSLPDMTGEQVFATMRQSQPDLPVIMCSGYFENMRKLDGEKNVMLLNKPFRLPTLVNMVADLSGRAE